jgi:hypothetical protein
MRKLLLKPQLYEQTILLNKKETRRTHGLDAVNEKPDDWRLCDTFMAGNQFFAVFATERKHAVIRPLYNIYETLYLAEPHWAPKFKIEPHQVDEHVRYCYDKDFNVGVQTENFQKCYKKVSPLFMKEIYAREFVKITDIKIERLQDITEDGCRREGMVLTDHENYRDAFIYTWISINGMQGWNSNPWVWVYQYDYLKNQSRRKQ